MKANTVVLSGNPDAVSACPRWWSLFCKSHLLALGIALGSVCVVRTADAEVTGSWLYDAAAQTISDGNWTLNVQVENASSRLLRINGGSTGEGILDLTKPVSTADNAEWFIAAIQEAAFKECSRVTDIRLGGPQLTSIGGQAFYKCANVTNLELAAENLTTLNNSYNAFASLGTAGTTYVTVKKIFLPKVTTSNYGIFANIAHQYEDNGAVSRGEDVYMPLLSSIGGATFQGLWTSARVYGWNGPMRFPSAKTVAGSSFGNLKGLDVLEVGRGDLQSVAELAFDQVKVDNLILGCGSNQLDLNKVLFQYSQVKTMFVNGCRPQFPAGGTAWWKGGDSFGARTFRLAIPKGDDSWGDLIAEAQKAENQPTASELNAYRSRYPNCQDPIGKLPGKVLGLENEQWLSYGCPEGVLRDLHVESNVSTAVPGTSPAAKVWPTGKWYRSTDVEHVTAPAGWVKAEDGWHYRAIGYVYERATDFGWQPPITNFATSVDITFENAGAQRVTWLFEKAEAVGNGDGDEARAATSLSNEQIVKIGSGVSRIYGTAQFTPKSVCVDAGTLAFGAPETTNHFFRFTFSRMVPTSAAFDLSMLRFTDAAGTLVGGTGYALADAACVPRNMAAKSVWFSRTDYATDESKNYKQRTPDCVMDGNNWTHLTCLTHKLSADDPTTWVQLIVRMPTTAGRIAGYNFNCGYGNIPGGWTLETSPDGETWSQVDVRKDESASAPASGSAKWYNDGADFAFGSGDLPGGGGLEPSTPLMVASGATFDGSNVGESGQELASLVVDLAGGGTLKGVCLANVGTLDVIVPVGTKPRNCSVPLAFVDSIIPSDLSGWTVTVNGQPSRLVLMKKDGGLYLGSRGMIILLR